MSLKETLILAALGFGIWLNGAVTYRFGGAMMFESGPLALLITALAIAVAVCLLLKSVMGWRKLGNEQAVAVATIMILPGLFGDVVYILNFARFTGLQAVTAGPFAAVLVFGTAVLMAYALVLARKPRIP